MEKTPSISPETQYNSIPTALKNAGGESQNASDTPDFHAEVAIRSAPDIWASVGVPPGQTPSVRHIQELVCARYGVTLDEMLGARGRMWISHARQVAMWLAWPVTTATWPELGLRFHRDHSTVMHGVARIDARMAADPEYDAEMRALRFALLPRPEGPAA